MEDAINEVIDNSEIAGMASSYFDEESAAMMIQELKEKILEVVNKNKLWAQQHTQS